MSEPHVIRCYEYVTTPYEQVRDALRQDPLGFFQRATTEAASRAKGLVTTLHVRVGSIAIGTDAVVVVRSIVEEPSAPGIHVPRTRLAIEWTAAQAAAFFPSMTAELSVYPLSKDETQLDFYGRYAPPLGLFGEAVDALVGHRIAEASVHRFVEDVAARLRQELAAPRKVSAIA
jgi:hypothetical protein